jgi:hypothetical protein
MVDPSEKEENKLYVKSSLTPDLLRANQSIRRRAAGGGSCTLR